MKPGWLWLVAAWLIPGCAPQAQAPAQETSADSYVVRSEAQAIAIAKATWTDLDLRDRKLKVGLDEGDWVVQRERRAGEPTEEALIINAGTGAARRSSTGVTTVYLNQARR